MCLFNNFLKEKIMSENRYNVVENIQEKHIFKFLIEEVTLIKVFSDGTKRRVSHFIGGFMNKSEADFYCDEKNMTCEKVEIIKGK